MPDSPRRAERIAALLDRWRERREEFYALAKHELEGRGGDHIAANQHHLIARTWANAISQLEAALPLPGEAQAQTATCWCDRLRAAGGGATVQCPPCLARRAGEAIQQQAQDYKSHLAGLGKWQQRCAQAEHRITDLERENASLRYLHAAPEALERQIAALKHRITDLEAHLATREALDQILVRQAVRDSQRSRELEDRLAFYQHHTAVLADAQTTDVVDARPPSLEGRDDDPARSEEEHAKPLMEGQLRNGIVQLKRATKDSKPTA